MDSTALARQIAVDTITALEMDRRGWVVLSVGPAELPPVAAPHEGLDSADHLVIDVGEQAVPQQRVSVHFMVSGDAVESVVATAAQLQDHAIEWTGGEPLPKCPKHQHPLTPRAVASQALWVCPVDVAHYSKPILQDRR